jgi:hypothetical protein
VSYIPDALRKQVIQRAGNCCEYCRLPKDANFFPHEIDHVVAEKHGGRTDFNNLCLSCFDCNRHKGSNIASIDPHTDEVVRLFHPRKDRWDDHFQIQGGIIEGVTVIGRVTTSLLKMNTVEQIEKRQGLIDLGLYPC